MAVYVDPLFFHGWRLRGRPTKNCHLFTDSDDLADLHAMAARIGMKRAWFQDERVKHYDLTPSRRAAAVAAGAVEVDFKQAVAIWRGGKGP